ncbi:MAG: hypothetical protein ACR2KF_00700 [Nitrososphaeraceae archaeon]
MSRNFKLYFVSILTLIGFVLFANYGLSNAQSNIIAPNLTAPSLQPNLTAPSLQPNLTMPNGSPTVDIPNTSSSISDTVNDVLSGSIDGMIGETVDMLSSDTAKVGDDSSTSSLENELPSSITLDKNNQSAVQDTPLQTRIESNTTSGVLNNSKIIPADNESTSDSVDEIKQSLQKSMYNSSIVQSFDNNSITKIVNQDTFDQFVYKMKNILDIDLFK